jgi:hypothetical protein
MFGWRWQTLRLIVRVVEKVFLAFGVVAVLGSFRRNFDLHAYLARSGCLWRSNKGDKQSDVDNTDRQSSIRDGTHKLCVHLGRGSRAAGGGERGQASEVLGLMLIIASEELHHENWRGGQRCGIAMGAPGSR